MSLPIIKTLEKLDVITAENEQYFVKLIFFKQFLTDVRWHITLPEFNTPSGFYAFCGHNSWSQIDTQNCQRLYRLMESEHSYFCERCAEEFQIAYPELKRQGYLTWKTK